MTENNGSNDQFIIEYAASRFTCNHCWYKLFQSTKERYHFLSFASEVKFYDDRVVTVYVCENCNLSNFMKRFILTFWWTF